MKPEMVQGRGPVELRAEIVQLRCHIKDLQWALEMLEKMSANGKDGLDELFGWSATMANATRADKYPLSRTYIRMHRAAAKAKKVEPRI